MISHGAFPSTPSPASEFPGGVKGALGAWGTGGRGQRPELPPSLPSMTTAPPPAFDTVRSGPHEMSRLYIIYYIFFMFQC